MEFCSKYGYNYGFDGSDSESVSDEETSTKKKVTRKIRKADSNIIAVKFDQLVMPNEMFAGDPIKCQKCEAIMSKFSKANMKKETKLIWTCDFCFQENDLSSKIKSLDEIPNQDDVTFLLEPAPVKTDEPKSSGGADAKAVSADNSYFTFCIDVSGSMDTMIQIKKQKKEANPQPDQMMQQQISPIFGGSPVSNSDFEETNMSRLQGVKVAAVENLSKLKEEEPNKRVSLVTFSDAIKFYGDGSKVRNNEPLLNIGGHRGYGFGGYGYPQQQMQQQQSTLGSFLQRANNFLSRSSTRSSNNNSDSDSDQPNQPQPNAQEIPADILENKEKMIALAKNQDGNLNCIKETYANLEQKIKLLRTEGSTALGPALVFSIGFSSKKSGSQIILCTDGCANVGMGSVEHGNQAQSVKFYEDLADYAKENGVTVNVISMEGTDCKLALLGKVADRSNGTLSIVNPLNLSEQFKSILENRIVATSVKAKLIVNHKYLYIRDDQLETEESKAIESEDQAAKEKLNEARKSILVKDIGNANLDTEITFEYGVRKLKGEEKKNKNAFKELPFQLQISYTTMDGAKAIRVYTKLQEFTSERQVAEQNVQSSDLIFSNAVQKMSYQVMSSNVGAAKYREAAMNNLQMRCNFAMPAAYTSNSSAVRNISKSTKAEDLCDDFAEEMYSGKKMNRKKFSK